MRHCFASVKYIVMDLMAVLAATQISGNQRTVLLSCASILWTGSERLRGLARQRRERAAGARFREAVRRACCCSERHGVAAAGACSRCACPSRCVLQLCMLQQVRAPAVHPALFSGGRFLFVSDLGSHFPVSLEQQPADKQPVTSSAAVVHETGVSIEFHNLIKSNGGSARRRPAGGALQRESQLLMAGRHPLLRRTKPWRSCCW